MDLNSQSVWHLWGVFAEAFCAAAVEYGRSVRAFLPHSFFNLLINDQAVLLCSNAMYCAARPTEISEEVPDDFILGNFVPICGQNTSDGASSCDSLAEFVVWDDIPTIASNARSSNSSIASNDSLAEFVIFDDIPSDVDLPAGAFENQNELFFECPVNAALCPGKDEGQGIRPQNDLDRSEGFRQQSPSRLDEISTSNDSHSNYFANLSAQDGTMLGHLLDDSADPVRAGAALSPGSPKEAHLGKAENALQYNSPSPEAVAEGSELFDPHCDTAEAKVKGRVARPGRVPSADT